MDNREINGRIAELRALRWLESRREWQWVLTEPFSREDKEGIDIVGKHESEILFVQVKSSVEDIHRPYKGIKVLLVESNKEPRFLREVEVLYHLSNNLREKERNRQVANVEWLERR